MKNPKCIYVDGLRLPPSFDPETFRFACNYKPEKGDIIVATYPKCGTTWAIQIVLLILRNGEPPATAAEYFASNPFLEMTGKEELKKRLKPGCLKTHLPRDRLNFSKEAKYIYITRQPADCLLSYYHHLKFFPIYCFSDGILDDIFELFIKGDLDFGDYFDHLLSWYEYRNEPNVLFTTYEDMQKDHRGTVLKIAKFLGQEYYGNLLRDNGRLLDKVMYYSSLEYMKETTNKFWVDTFAGPPPVEAQKENIVLKKYAELLENAKKEGHISTGDFVRKGGVGEGKVSLSKEQMDKLKAHIRSKCADSDVMNLWNNS